MKHFLSRTLCIALACGTLSARAQHSSYLHNHGVDVSVGLTGHFEHQLNDDGGSTTSTTVNGPGGAPYGVSVTNQQQNTTSSFGVLYSMQFHPVSWAGVEVNYGYTHYSERYTFNYLNNQPALSRGTQISTGAHEATAAYIIHPRHIPFQPFVGLGGGYIDFVPRRVGSNQWRGAGLAEVGFDIPTHMSGLGFRVEGRGLAYRAPNFGSSAISTRTWRATVEPVAAVYYRF